MGIFQVLSDQELKETTSGFQTGGYQKDRALDLVASAALSLITEPGDKVAGALSRTIGKLRLLELLIDGFQYKTLIAELKSIDAYQDLCFEFVDLESTLVDSRQRWLPRLSKTKLLELFARSHSMGLKLLTSSEKAWPQGLIDLQDSAPGILYVEGNQKVVSELQTAVSIVGSRVCSKYGLNVAEQLVRALSRSGRPTVSGGAIGIDEKVHRASVENNLPTIAVMAGGLDRKYPRANFGLFSKMLEQGAVISELPPGVAPSRWRFLQRNRLIAALTPTTVVVEAGHRSGSIRTANNAIDLDRELFAVPGSILSASHAGSNSLIGHGKATALFDIGLFSSGEEISLGSSSESSLAKRAQDSIRDLRFPTREEIAINAGLTKSELSLALAELSRQNQVIDHLGSDGVVHYALKYA